MRVNKKIKKITLYILIYGIDCENEVICREDMTLIIINDDNKYYLTNIVEYAMTSYIKSVNGNSFKPNYDKQMRYYGDGFLEGN